MLKAYKLAENRLELLPPGTDLDAAVWIDLYSPTEAQLARVSDLVGGPLPPRAEMEEIEMSSRLYRMDDRAYMTAVMLGHMPDGTHVTGPVSLILGQGRLVSMRYHAPRPFETFPERAHHSTSGVGDVERVFLGLIEEIIARMADQLEGVGHELDEAARKIFGGPTDKAPAQLQRTLETAGRQGELVSQIRMGLVSVERVLSFHLAGQARHGDGKKLAPIAKSHFRDIQALEVHADFLTSRVSLVVDATMGMINLQQNSTMRVLSVVSALFLPPTLIASTYGMNFEIMPELSWRYGYVWALCLMVGSATLTYLVLRWRRWL